MSHESGILIRVPQTVFIIGAGASKEAELPVGDELAESIGTLLDLHYNDMGMRERGDPQIVAALEHHVRGRRGELTDYVHAARRISQGMPYAASIDNFLDAHRGDQRIGLCGKLAIVKSILIAERSSRLYVNSRQPNESLRLDDKMRASWFNQFWRLLCEGCTAAQALERARSVSFVVFNYDRCIQHFLYHAARTYYGMGQKEAVALVGAITFYHPYGSVATLPWQLANDGPHIEYGGDARPDQLLALSQRIKTFTESTAPDAIEPIRTAINAATHVISLGFAFHVQNIRLLWPGASDLDDGARGRRRFFGTAKNISHDDRRIIENELAHLGGFIPGHSALRHDLLCAQLFPEYKRTLSLA